MRRVTHSRPLIAQNAPADQAVPGEAARIDQHQRGDPRRVLEREPDRRVAADRVAEHDCALEAERLGQLGEHGRVHHRGRRARRLGRRRVAVPGPVDRDDAVVAREVGDDRVPVATIAGVGAEQEERAAGALAVPRHRADRGLGEGHGDKNITKARWYHDRTCPTSSARAVTVRSTPPGCWPPAMPAAACGWAASRSPR